MSEAPATHGYTYDDLAGFPDDGHRREIIGGELIVNPAPAPRHQDAVLELGAGLLAWTKQHGGKVYVAPLDVYFAHDDVVEPDVVFLRPEHLTPALHGSGEHLTTPAAPGFRVAVDDVLGLG